MYIENKTDKQKHTQILEKMDNHDLVNYSRFFFITYLMGHFMPGLVIQLAGHSTNVQVGQSWHLPGVTMSNALPTVTGRKHLGH